MSALGTLVVPLGGILLLLLLLRDANAQLLKPPLFNLAEGKRITATATCGDEGEELYCKLVGANAQNVFNINVIQGQACDYCDLNNKSRAHPPEYAVDGMETWWQSPPLSRGMKFNEVNLTIELGQEFHVAYVFVQMGNSPRPEIWTLEKSSDYGKTYTPWQYFTNSLADCETYFGKDTLLPITKDDSVICNTEYAKTVPLEGGEIPVILLDNRPSSKHYFNSTVLQEWTRATNVRLRLLRTNSLKGHLMSVRRQDPTVTRRYFYSIKDISIGGRCMCNGHAETCDIPDLQDPNKLHCRCQHHTCGPQCQTCCTGFEQKAWKQSQEWEKFVCEPCNCFNHSNECDYDSEIDAKRLSLDIHGKYNGGGVCKNCQHNTEGINCNKCKATYFKPAYKIWNEVDACKPCKCHFDNSTGNCADETGQCECKENFLKPYCNDCSRGYYDFPECKPCMCYLEGVEGNYCVPAFGEVQCPCKYNYHGQHCDSCAEGYYNFPKCEECGCNQHGSTPVECDQTSGNCTCDNNFAGRTCDSCGDGYYNYPTCKYCSCDSSGTLPGICNKTTGSCLCKEGFGGVRCDQCTLGYYSELRDKERTCIECNCSKNGSMTTNCDAFGKCSCLYNFGGQRCDQCSPGYYNYPECLPCNCDSHGAIGVTCDSEGQCQCKNNFDKLQCSTCKEGYYNFPVCEECNCDPNGVIESFGGCGSVPIGELCQCKERVQGRICNQCKPLFWNLQQSNELGCDDCDCNQRGSENGISVCDSKSGQCVCKYSVDQRECNECKDGSFNLTESNIFGCTDCGCDNGGSINNVCNKETGQCTCKPRVTGLQCNEPITSHYFHTLHQYQYEVENGYTPSDSRVRYQFSQERFPNFSWKGYAVFSSLQNEIRQDVRIFKPSMYQMVLRYVKPVPGSIIGKITITPENTGETEQSFDVLLKETTTPTFVTVSGVQGIIPSPFVMNPGNWRITIKTDKTLYLDYFVLIPSAYYEATILSKKVVKPCVIGDKGLCRHFAHPDLKFDSVKAKLGNIAEGGVRSEIYQFVPGSEYHKELNETHIPLINNDQEELVMDVKVTKPGNSVILIEYITLPENENGAYITATVRSESSEDSSKVYLNACPYTSACRQVLLDENGRVKMVKINDTFVGISIKGEPDSSVGIVSATVIPQEKWNLDYLRPQSVCVRRNGKCIQSEFPIVPDSKKVEFETKKDNSPQVRPPNIFDNTTELMYLNDTITLKTKVPLPGPYVFIVQYYQPYSPEHNLDVSIENEDMIINHEASLPIKHCPSNSGCRSIIRSSDGSNQFMLTENFMLTILKSSPNAVWIASILVVPASQYENSLLEENRMDQTREFIASCGNDHFYINVTDNGFCRESVFSLTSDYNNGAASCSCNGFGSLSFECNKFGGQCDCKPHVIGRRCESCENGYYGFPDCLPCNCPFSARCEEETGECICPTRVYGEKCDKCEPYTYGFDAIIGCENCNCDKLGVLNEQLQCDLLNGSCSCKPNVVGRTCDQCVPGYFSFPDCDPCDCSNKGTTDEICDQNDARCFCKANVDGNACNTCKEGTFNMRADNDAGCTKCFCFGKTTSCNSANLYWSTINDINNWSLYNIIISHNVTVQKFEQELEVKGSNTLVANIPDDVDSKVIAYFSASNEYLGNKLAIYGGMLNYSIYYTTLGTRNAISHGDVILYGANTWLIHAGIEQPPGDTYWKNSLTLTESEFFTDNHLPATRELLMTVLEDLQGLYIRASYWESGVMTKLVNISVDTGVEIWNKDSEPTYAIEKCECPENYKGNSCEECADGFYRISSGPHGGYCVPCQCNNHAVTCDVNTGICINCQHNTYGDHCDKCITGFHGNATQKSPNDCLICACPLPTETNNFATSCEFSPEGDEISCNCHSQYGGPQCEYCAPGFYGRPRDIGDYCKPCQCSGNINPTDPAACDTLTGQCLKCMNNTFGQACNLCRPGFFGDAIQLKDCQVCMCDQTGMDRCNNYNGTCVCKPGVVSEKCDRCETDHWGFDSGTGCTVCNCSVASLSTQCDDLTGHCKCKPGVTGKNCDRCATGFWNFTEDGCITCGCNTGYSRGFGCNPNTGQCECLPGVIGDKCDSCPFRNILIPDSGCLKCSSCIHNLLDSNNDLKNIIDPIMDDFENKASGFFTRQRLVHFDDEAAKWEKQVDNLPSNIKMNMRAQAVKNLENETSLLEKKMDYSDPEKINSDAKKLVNDSEIFKAQVIQGVEKAKITVEKIEQLAENFEISEAPKVDNAISEARQILSDLRAKNFDNELNTVNNYHENANKIMEKIKKFIKPVNEHNKIFNESQIRLNEFGKQLDDLQKINDNLENTIDKSSELNLKNIKSEANSKDDKIKKEQENSRNNLLNAGENLKNAILLLNSTKYEINNITVESNEVFMIRDQLNQTSKEPLIINNLVSAAKNHTENIINESKKRMKNLDSENRDSKTENAVTAASAYTRIVEEINLANDNINAAVDAENNITKLMDAGIKSNSTKVKSVSDSIHDQSKNALDDIKSMDYSKDDLNDTKSRYDKVKEKIYEKNGEFDEIMKKVDNYSESFIPKLLNANITSDNALKKTKEALQTAKKYDTTDVKNKTMIISGNSKIIDKNKNLINQQIETWNNNYPNISSPLENTKEKGSSLESKLEALQRSKEDLQNQIANAKGIVDQVSLGVKFDDHNTLQLPLPDDLDELGVITKVSAYFKTVKDNGFLMYLGNFVGTKLRRTRRDDFMALEIENGYPVLAIDIGNGTETIVLDNKTVSDDKWYQVIVDRYGNNVKFSIQEDTSKGSKIYTKEHKLQGEDMIFHLNKDQSKLYVGGYPNYGNKIQPNLKFSSFEGKIEGLVIGETPVSLWNFIEARGNNELAQRDDGNTGYSFNGKGYVILQTKDYYRLKEHSFIELSFKTTSRDGLLFLMGKNKSFLSIEMRNNGQVFLQFRLGEDLCTIGTLERYNDGKWHNLSVTRSKNIGILKIDNETNEDTAKDGEILQMTGHIYIGGYPNKHNYDDVINQGFDGCIDNLTLSGNQVNLTTNLATSGVKPGCPTKVTTLVEIEKDSGGYIQRSNVSVSNNFNITIKFKTSASEGLLFYATDKNTAAISLSMLNGKLVAKSQKEELHTEYTYNDDQWHIATTIHDSESLRIIVDDYDYKSTDSSPPKLYFMYGNLFIGGIPSDYMNLPGGPVTSKTFTGCFGDTIMNGVLVNFATTIDKYSEKLHKCSAGGLLTDKSKIILPVNVPLITDNKTSVVEERKEKENTKPPKPPAEIPTVKSEESVKPEPEKFEPVKPEPVKPEPEKSEPEKSEPEKSEPEIVEAPATIPVVKTPNESITPVKPIIEKKNIVSSVEGCALGYDPLKMEYDSTDGYRFGTRNDSRIEFSILPSRYKNSFTFSVNINTGDENGGLIFYSADKSHKDFVVLYMNNGKVHYAFNCGTGPVRLVSPKKYNDTKWHTIIFSRENQSGKLVIDGELIDSGDSVGAARSMIMESPFYYGGIKNVTTDISYNLRDEYSPFNGCLKNLLLNDKPINSIQNKMNVLPCIENEEQGIFFGSSGGYLKVSEKFKVGLQISISIDVKPRNTSGLLMVIHGKKDYLVLEIVDDAIVLRVENGKGPFEALYKLVPSHLLCDGNWHSIQALKFNNVVSVGVDGRFGQAVIGENTLSTDTKSPIFIGGHPRIERGVRGAIVKRPYFGCMKNLNINGKPLEIPLSRANGDVYIGMCPSD